MKFKILATEYTADGALTNPPMQHIYTPDAPDEALALYNSLRSQYQTDADGNRTVNRVYRVEFFVPSWKKVEDPAAFAAQFDE